MKKILTIIGAVLVLILGAGGVYAVMNNNTNKQYDEAIAKAETKVKEHAWSDAQSAYKDAEKIKKTDMTTAANEQLTAIQNAELIAGNDQQGAIDILDKSMKQSVTVPVIMTEMKTMKEELQKQLDKTKKEESNNGSRSDISSEKDATKPDDTTGTQPNVDPANPKQPESNNKEVNAAEGNMTVAEARARLAEQGKNIDFVPDAEVQRLIDAVKASDGAKSLQDIATEMRW